MDEHVSETELLTVADAVRDVFPLAEEIIENARKEIARLTSDNEQLKTTLQAVTEYREGKHYALKDVMTELKGGQPAKSHLQQVEEERDAAVAALEPYKRDHEAMEVLRESAIHNNVVCQTITNGDSVAQWSLCVSARRKRMRVLNDPADAIRTAKGGEW